MSKDKPTALFAIKTYSFDAVTCHLFYTAPFFPAQYLLFTSVTKSC